MRRHTACRRKSRSSATTAWRSSPIPATPPSLAGTNTLSAYLKSHFGRVHAGDYVAMLAYIERDGAATEVLTAMRARIRDRIHAATCVGFGPRFQHSTGQAYKGGPNSGVFLQITCDDSADIDVPGHSYSFGVVKAAQARGDLDVLVERGRRALRVHLGDVDAGLTALARAIGMKRSDSGTLTGRIEKMQIGVIGLGRMGGQHLAAPDEGGAQMRGVRRQRRAARGAGQGWRHCRRLAGRRGEGVGREAARHLGDAARRRHHRGDGGAPR